MKKVLFIGILAYICAISLCQDYQETEQLASVTTEAIKPSMINMISKYIELNGQIDDVLKSSTTETYVKSSGICETEETYIEEVTVTERIPHQVEVEVWCWSIRCTELETHYREERRQQNVTKTRKVLQCCENYEMVLETNECQPICNVPCENYGTCVAPDTCKCEFGYEGQNCEIDSLPEGILAGPNVCEREEMREEQMRVTEQQLVQVEVKEWCWPKIRCTKSKTELQPIVKMQKIVKPYRIRYCCDGYAQNFMGNRCIPIQLDDYQQQIIQ